MTTSTEMVKPMTDTRTTMTKVKLISYVFTHTVLYFFSTFQTIYRVFE